jgi:general stress protein 26
MPRGPGERYRPATMSTIESDMLGYEERGVVGGGQGRAPAPRRSCDWAPPDAETARKISQLVKDIGVAMLTTVAPDGALRSRPMATQGRGVEQGELWFFTRDDSGKVSEIEADHEVNLAYAEPKGQRYVSLAGRATVLRDPERARQLWSQELDAWFPAGPEDPHLALLRVRVHGAEAWEGASGKMTALINPAMSGPRDDSPTREGDQKVMVAY